jgi:large subunit ribosomal protein L37Ae
MSGNNVRSGAELRKRENKIRKSKSSKYACLTCGKTAVKRKSNSRWECQSCGGVFAGGTYALTTPTGTVSLRLASEYKKR